MINRYKLMVKKFTLTSFLLAFSISAFATDLSGVYKCTAFDSNDGEYAGTLTMKSNKAYNKANSPYGTYDFTLTAKGFPYSFAGIAAANGTNFSMYFESVGEKRDPSDRGVGIATVVRDVDHEGKDVISFHAFYFEKAYKGRSSFGFENCTLSN